MADGSVTIDAVLNSDNFKRGIGTLGNIAKKGLKGVVTMTAGVTAGFVAITKASLDSYAVLEQNIGGIQTLFKNSANEVIKNANNAYKTAGMSANKYMEMVTGFSASLLKSLGGDTEEATKIADMALRDMSDNANKMGTSIELIQNAYQGFAKQNYTMLDNLKLGYGGTKTEMERLLKDAQKISGVKYDISNLNDVFNAIHIIQKELDITGTTAKEAESTISGSMASLKASWDNFLNSSGDIEAVVETASNVVNNVLKATSELVPRIINQLAIGMPQMIETGGQLLQSILQGLISNSESLLTTVFQIISMLANAFIIYLPELLKIGLDLLMMIATGIIENLPYILEIGIKILLELINGITEMLPELVPLAINCIMLIANSLIENIDTILEAGIEIIFALIEGIAEALPELIPKIVNIIIKIMEVFNRNFDKLLWLGIQVILGLIKGLIKSIPDILANLPTIIMAIINFFSLSKFVSMGKTVISGIKTGLTEHLPNLLKEIPKLVGKIIDLFKTGVNNGIGAVGKNIVSGLWNGISGSAGWLAGKVKTFASNILKNMKNALGIHSPSRLFRDEVGKYIALGVGEGFSDNISNVYKKMKTAVDFQTQKLSTSLSTTANVNRSLTANISITGDTYLDREKVGQIMTPEISKNLAIAGV